MWYEQNQWRNRLTAETEVMRSRFPSFSLLRTEDGQLHWIGVLAPVASYPFLVAASYPDRYPYAEWAYPL